MKPSAGRILTGMFLVLATGTVMRPAGETVATAIYARVGNDYERKRTADGGFAAEYYALSNGGRIAGTASDVTIDRVGYPEVAMVATRLLAQQNYHYAPSKEQAKLLIVLQWGSTIAPNGTNYSQGVNEVARVLATEPPQGMGTFDADADSLKIGQDGPAEAAMLTLLVENRVRDQLNARNARVLGYLDELNESNDIRRWAGGGDRYNDLIGDVEESRYYIVISAFDFPELLEKAKKTLLWQVRVSVRTPGNGFDESFVAMLKGASKYFGRDSGRLIRGEESKGTVEMGDLKFLGEAMAREKSPTNEGK
jgi:hypothetical protein